MISIKSLNRALGLLNAYCSEAEASVQIMLVELQCFPLISFKRFCGIIRLTFIKINRLLTEIDDRTAAIVASVTFIILNFFLSDTVCNFSQYLSIYSNYIHRASTELVNKNNSTWRCFSEQLSSFNQIFLQMLILYD